MLPVFKMDSEFITYQFTSLHSRLAKEICIIDILCKTMARTYLWSK